VGCVAPSDEAEGVADGATEAPGAVVGAADAPGAAQSPGADVVGLKSELSAPAGVPAPVGAAAGHPANTVAAAVIQAMPKLRCQRPMVMILLLVGATTGSMPRSTTQRRDGQHARRVTLNALAQRL
jgi:hypothetical protein